MPKSAPALYPRASLGIHEVKLFSPLPTPPVHQDMVKARALWRDEASICAENHG